MYGKEYASANVDAEGNGKVLTTIEQLGAGLKAAEALAIVCDTEPLPENIASTLINEAGDKLSRVVLVSRMGITRAKPAGPFGFGGGDAALQATEKTLAEVTKANGVGLSIICVGTLKGGGPGNEAVGLSKAYDDGIGDLGTFISDNEAILTRKEPKQEAAPVVAKKPAKTKKAPKLTKCGAEAVGPTAEDLAKIEALNAKVSRIPATDLFED